MRALWDERQALQMGDQACQREMNSCLENRLEKQVRTLLDLQVR